MNTTEITKLSLGYADNTMLKEIIVVACKQRVDHFHGNISKAARYLAISRQTIYKYLKEYDMIWSTINNEK